MIKLFDVKTYQERINEIYADLWRNMSTMSLEWFEARCRDIHGLNKKILDRAAYTDKNSQ